MKGKNAYIYSDFKRAFSLKFIIALILFVSFKYITIKNELSLDLQNGDLMYFSLFILSDMFFGVFAAFCLIPFGTSYSEDLNTGFYKYHIIKGDRESYINSKLLTLFLSSLLTALMAYLLLFLLLSFKVPLKIDPQKLTYGTDRPIYFLELSNPIVFLFIMVLLRSLYISFLCQLSFLINLFSKNAIVLFMMPSFLFMISSRFHRYFKNSLTFMNLNLLSQARLRASSALSASIISVGLFLFFISLVSILTYKKMEGDLSI